MPRISFVMPTRDRDDLIEESIESILKQTINDWELIIVDDHSSNTDKTEEVVKNLNDERIKYFKLSDKNGKGISAARNFGNIQAQSEIIAVCDSDDINHPERIEFTLQKMVEGNYDIVYGRVDVWDPATGEVRARHGGALEREFNLEELKTNYYIPHSTVSYLRQIAVDFPYNSFFEVSEDYDLITRLANYNYKFGFIAESIVKYRRHPNAINLKNKVFDYDYGKIVRNNRGWE
jgi:glycosyltransferase involved in cell wall biosynthesis